MNDHMERVQFKISNLFKIIFYLVLSRFFLAIILFHTSSLRDAIRGAIWEAIASFFYFLIFSGVFYFFYRNENEDESNSLYMNTSQVLFYNRNVRHEYSWDKLETSISFRIFNLVYIIKFFSEGMDEPYYFILFSPTKDSFLQVVENNAPKDHPLFSIANKFKESNS